MIKLALLLSSLIYLISCSGTPNSGQKGNHAIVDKVHHIGFNDSLLTQWRQDSIGCLKYRTYEIVKQLNTIYQLEKKTSSDLVELLGEPNRIIRTEAKGKVYRYFYNTCCKDGVLDKECDYSWVDFNFETNQSNSNFITSGTM